MLNDECKIQLRDWRFTRAVREIDEQASRPEVDLLAALSTSFGDSGRFDGALSLVVGVAVNTLLEEDQTPEATA